VAWHGKLAAAVRDADDPPSPKPRRRRGRPPIHLSASLNLVLPSQLFPEFESDARTPGEKRLMLAVLRDAIDVFLKYDPGCVEPRQRRLYVDAAGWIGSDETESPFSFVNVCETLGLSASCLRRGLEKLARARR
jgi:hypothetical protein